MNQSPNCIQVTLLDRQTQWRASTLVVLFQTRCELIEHARQSQMHNGKICAPCLLRSHRLPPRGVAAFDPRGHWLCPLSPSAACFHTARKTISSTLVMILCSQALQIVKMTTDFVGCVHVCSCCNQRLHHAVSPRSQGTQEDSASVLNDKSLQDRQKTCRRAVCTSCAHPNSAHHILHIHVRACLQQKFHNRSLSHEGSP